METILLWPYGMFALIQIIKNLVLQQSCLVKEKIAVANNFELIYFISGINRKEAHNFYKKQGYKSDNNIAFVKYL